nr:hypothetical protein [Xylella fastidiosa]
MFPMTVTITDQAQLNAVLAVLHPPSRCSPAQPVLDDTPRSDNTPSPPPAAPPPPRDTTPHTAKDAPRTAEPVVTEVTTEPASALTYVDVAKALTRLSKDFKREYGDAILKSFGVTGLSQIPPELYPTLMEHIEGYYIAHELDWPLENET